MLSLEARESVAQRKLAQALEQGAQGLPEKEKTEHVAKDSRVDEKKADSQENVEGSGFEGIDKTVEKQIDTPEKRQDQSKIDGRPRTMGKPQRRARKEVIKLKLEGTQSAEGRFVGVEEGKIAANLFGALG